MEFKHVQDKVCRHCGAKAIRETWQGLDGSPRLERRDFECGAESVWWDDNTLRESRGCPNNPERKEAWSRAESALEEVRCVVAKHVMDLPERCRQDILNGADMAQDELKRSL